MLNKISTHVLAMFVGAAAAYSLTALSHPSAQQNTAADMSIGVYKIAEELLKPTLITKDTALNMALADKEGKPVVISLTPAKPDLSAAADYLDVTVNGESIKIDANGTAVIEDIMVILVDHTSYQNQ